MSYYSNPTENSAIGAVDREIKIMRKRAQQIRNLRKKGLLTHEQEICARREFTGIYRRLLLEALET